MKKLLLLIALLLPALFVTAQGIKNGLKEEPKINVGIKGGFNSSMYFTSRLELDGERMEDVQNNYKVGKGIKSLMSKVKVRLSIPFDFRNQCHLIRS